MTMVMWRRAKKGRRERRHPSYWVEANAFAFRARLRGLARHLSREFLHVAAGLASPSEGSDFLE